MKDEDKTKEQLVNKPAELRQRVTEVGPSETERKQAKEALRRYAERLKILREIDRAILAAQSPETIAQAALCYIGDLVPCLRASVALFDLEADEAEVFAIQVSDETRLGAGTQVSLEDYGVPEELLQGEVHIVEDILSFSEASPVDQTLHAEGIRSYINVPLISQEGLIGALNVGAANAGAFVPEHIEIAREVADQLAIAIRQARLTEQVQRHATELEQRVAERTAELKAANEQLRREITDRKRAELALLDEVKTKYNYEEIIGKSAAIQDMLKQVELVATTDATALILGETGTGKELVCRAIHHFSPRNARPLVKLNCAAIPSSLIESELFGHEKGAFTGAILQKQGRFELAHRGTIFLDEVGDLPLDAQSKLLRVLEEQEFERVGGTRTIKIDTRVIAATHRDLDQMVKDGSFREDLFYRLNVFPITLPPLRDRREDIPLLADYFVRSVCARLGRSPCELSGAVLQRLLAYPWPGNVRELEHIIERAIILCGGRTIGPEHIQVDAGSPSPDEGRIQSLQEVEREHIIAALRAAKGRVSGKHSAAELLGLRKSTLQSRMKKLRIVREISHD